MRGGSRMRIQFDANQQFQLDAISAVTDLFDGQPKSAPEYALIFSSTGLPFDGRERTELGIGNRLLLDEDRLRRNTRLVQMRNDIEVNDPEAPLEAWELFDVAAGQMRRCPHFSVEMETGTGKSYIFLRTISELSQRYGFSKFVIVVPNVAIREGALKNIEITADHFRALYNNMPFEHFVYDARRTNRMRNSPSAIRRRSWLSTSMPSARISQAPRRSKRATSSTKRAISSPGVRQSNLCRQHDLSSS